MPSVLPDGGHALTIQNGTIERGGGFPAFRILHVSADSDLTLDGVTIRGGQAQGAFDPFVPTVSGGGILNNGDLTVTGSTILGNSAGFRGGGIYNNGDLTVTDSTLSGNSAGGGGGIFNLDGAAATVTDSTLSGNSAGFRGGGTFNNGDLTVTDSTLFGNSAGGGGGIYNYGTASTSSWVDRAATNCKAMPDATC